MGGTTKISKRKQNKMENKNLPPEKLEELKRIEQWDTERTIRGQAIGLAAQVHLGTAVSGDDLISYAEGIKSYLSAADVLKKLKSKAESADFASKLQKV